MSPPTTSFAEDPLHREWEGRHGDISMGKLLQEVIWFYGLDTAHDFLQDNKVGKLLVANKCVSDKIELLSVSDYWLTDWLTDWLKGLPEMFETKIILPKAQAKESRPRPTHGQRSESRELRPDSWPGSGCEWRTSSSGHTTREVVTNDSSSDQGTPHSLLVQTPNWTNVNKYPDRRGHLSVRQAGDDRRDCSQRLLHQRCRLRQEGKTGERWGRPWTVDWSSGLFDV